jgi:hypothetical protein
MYFSPPLSLASARAWLKGPVFTVPPLALCVAHGSPRGCSGMRSRLPLQRVLPLGARAPRRSPFRRRMQLRCGPSSRSGSRAGSTLRRTTRVSPPTPDVAPNPPPHRNAHSCTEPISAVGLTAVLLSSPPSTLSPRSLMHDVANALVANALVANAVVAYADR